MKRLVIILVVLVIGSGFSVWSLDMHSSGVIRLAATAEKSVDSEKAPDKTPVVEKADAADPNKTPDQAAEPEKTTAVEETRPVDPNRPPGPGGRMEGRRRWGGEGRDRGMGMDRGMGKGDAADKGEKQLKEGEDPNDPFVAINLNNIEMKQILTKLAAWTGKVIIPTDEAMKVKITIYADKEVPRSEALSLIYDALRSKGIIAEISENKLYLKPIAEAKLGYVPVLSANEPLARIKDKSQLAEKYFLLKNTSPAKLAAVITPLTASYGHVTAHESSNSLAVIDTVENLIRIEKTIAQFDVPESNLIIDEVFEIKNGDAIEIVQVLNLILNNTMPRSSNRSSSRPSSRPSSRSSSSSRPTSSSKSSKGAAAPATSVVIGADDNPIILLPVPKHNWIIVRASADNIEKIRKWITKLDIAESTPQEQTIIPIVYVDPVEVVRLVKNTIQNMPGSQLQTSIVVEAMRESKQVVIFGSEENRKFVERLIIEIDLPVEDIYKSRDFKLKHADPDEVKTNLEGLYEGQAGSFSSSNYGRGGGYSRSYRNVDPKDVVKVMSFPALKQISVVATEEKLKVIEAQIKEWDVPLDVKKDQYLLITLKNSDPVQMVELLSTLFSEDSEGSSSSSLMRMIFGRGNDMDSKKKIVGSLYGLLTFEAVPGTKKILVISKVPEAYDVIEALIEDLDSQEKGEAPKVITLNYADPEELCDQLNAILNERGTTATLKRRQQGLTLAGYKGTDSTASSGNNNNNNNQQQVDPGTIKPWWDSGRDDETEMPLSNLIGKIRFVPVHRSKAILIIAPPEYYDDIEMMVKKLDLPEMQVMIEAIIVEVDHSSMTSLGVQLSSNPSLFSSIGQNAITALTQLTHVDTYSSGITLDSALNINVLVDLLAKTVNAKVLNQPNLWTKDNEEAVFFKGREISIQTSDQSYNTGATSKTEYKQIPVGVTLRVRPNITPAKDVDITINLEISDLAVEEVNDQPVINKLNTSTNLIVADGETIMLGGILFQTESEIRSKVPLLGDIPILGAAFSHEATALRNNELLVFLTPHVVTDKKSEASKKFIVPSDQKDYGTNSKYIKNPAERMQDIRKSLDDVLSEGMMDIKP